MAFALGPNNFNFLKPSDCDKIAMALKDGEVDTVAKTFAAYLAEWNGSSWRDWDRWTVTTAELGSVGMWEKISIDDFLKRHGSEFSPEVFDEFVGCVKHLGHAVTCERPH
jgi:hypothetical protein